MPSTAKGRAGWVLAGCVGLAGAVCAGGVRAAQPAGAPEVAAVREGAPVDVGPLLEPIRLAGGLPALGAVVVIDGRIVAQGVAGVRRAGGRDLVTIEDRWHLGSCTKAMTATLAAILVEEGALRWDSTLGEVFADRAGAMHEGWRGVTLAQLCTNTSGAPKMLEEGGLWSRLWERKGTPTQQRLELLDGVTSRAPGSPPGTAYEYSNAGFAMAGAMLERVSGESWEALIGRRVFAPLGIGSAGFGAPGTGDETSPPDQPWGHRRDGTPVRPGPTADNPPAIGPAGTVHMSLVDWAKFVAAHAGGEGEGREGDARAWLISPGAYRALHTPRLQNYASGWSVTRRPWGGRGAGERVLTHAGSNTMWFCVTWFSPAKRAAVLVASNTGREGVTKSCDEAAWTLIKRYVAELPEAGGEAGGAEK